MTDRTRHYVAMAAVCAMAAATALSAEQPHSQTYESVDAQAVIITGFKGDLRLTSTAKPGVWLRLTGSKRQLDQLQISDSKSLFEIIGHGNDSVVAGHVIASSSGGGQAVVVIGGNEFTGTHEPPLSAELAVNTGLSVTLAEFVGTAHIAPRAGKLDIDLQAGQIELENIQTARLSVSGSGDIQVGAAQGDLQASLSGSGGIYIEQASLATLDAQLDGAGDIIIKGRAQRAALKLGGAGYIDVDEVAERPRISNQGAGTINVGNWASE